LKSGIMIPPALLFLLSNVLDTPNLFCFQKNLRVVFSFFFLLLYCWFYIYLHIYALFVPSCPHTPSPPNHPLPGRTCSTLFSNFVEEKPYETLRKVYWFCWFGIKIAIQRDSLHCFHALVYCNPQCFISTKPHCYILVSLP
jgi:hypothetical protein